VVHLGLRQVQAEVYSIRPRKESGDGRNGSRKLIFSESLPDEGRGS
jgi:hypothetical protein